MRYEEIKYAITCCTSPIKEEDKNTEEECADSAAAVEQAGARDAAANAATDGEAQGPGRQDDEAAVPGAAGPEAGAADDMQVQDADVKKLHTLPDKEFEEQGCNSSSFSTTPGESVPGHSASIGHNAAEHEAAEEQKKAERNEAKQRCNTTSTRTNGTEDKEKFQERAREGQEVLSATVVWHTHWWSPRSKEIRYSKCNRRHWAWSVCQTSFYQ